MKLKKCLFLVLALIFSILTYSTCSIHPIVSISKIRFDKVPILNIFVVGLEKGQSVFDASYLSEPIEWHQLDKEPEDWIVEGRGPWFYMNPYTKNLLKSYMRSNNLGIVPGDYSEFRYRINFEECLEMFEFVELGPPFPPQISTVLIIVFGCIATACWTMFGIVLDKSKNDPESE